MGVLMHRPDSTEGYNGNSSSHCGDSRKRSIMGTDVHEPFANQFREDIQRSVIRVRLFVIHRLRPHLLHWRQLIYAIRYEFGSLVGRIKFLLSKTYFGVDPGPYHSEGPDGHLFCNQRTQIRTADIIALKNRHPWASSMDGQIFLEGWEAGENSCSYNCNAKLKKNQIDQAYTTFRLAIPSYLKHARKSPQSLRASPATPSAHGKSYTKGSEMTR